MTAPVQDPPASGVALALTTPTGSAIATQRKMTMLRPLAQPAEVMEIQNETRALVHQALKEGRDYGVIPGTDRKTLLKPGAERVALAFGCYYGEPVLVEQEIDHDREVPWRKTKARWATVGDERKRVGEDVTEGKSLGLYRYVVKVPLIQRATGEVVGWGIGSCSTMESKYIDRPRDSENTVLKMGTKRAKIDGCLTTFGLSDEFTQDVEDLPQFTGEVATTPAQGNGAGGAATRGGSAAAGAANGTRSTGTTNAAAGADAPPCPKCGGKTWDNRASKRNPKAPDFKCRDRTCDGCIWPPKGDEPDAGRPAPQPRGSTPPKGSAAVGRDDEPPLEEPDDLDDGLPF